MPLIAYTHNGKPSAEGGRLIGYAYVNDHVFLPDAYVVQWMQGRMIEAAAHRAKESAKRLLEQDRLAAQAMDEYQAMDQATGPSNRCPSPDCRYQYSTPGLMQIGRERKRILTCENCGTRFRPY